MQRGRSPGWLRHHRLNELLQRGSSPEWLRHHRLNSLQRSKSSGNSVGSVAMMLLRCAACDALSFLPPGVSVRPRARLDSALSSHLARVASVSPQTTSVATASWSRVLVVRRPLERDSNPLRCPHCCSLMQWRQLDLLALVPRCCSNAPFVLL